eukprot:1382633-Pyramimonas_sp.AAC.1
MTVRLCDCAQLEAGEAICDEGDSAAAPGAHDPRRAAHRPQGVTYVSLASVAVPSWCYICVTCERRRALT